MATLLNSDTQYIDEATGELINNGYIYIGLDGLDAKLNPAIIYSDRGLTTVLSNPQRTGPDGRSLNKIWVDGKYSLKIENSANVQKLNELSLGESTRTDNTTLTNVQGADSLTANASPTITELVNNQVYILTAAANNTGPMTLTIDLTPTWPIKKHHDKDMDANDTEENQTLAVIFNETDSVFELMTNSAIGPVNLAGNQTIADTKTFTSLIVGDLVSSFATAVTGTDTYTASLTYVTGKTYPLSFANTNTVAAPTIDGKTIKNLDGSALAIGAIPDEAFGRYNGTDMILLNPLVISGPAFVASQFGGEYIKLSDVKATSTNGGTFTTGAWQTRTLNTEDSDTGNHCSLSSNQFILDAGTYIISAFAPAAQVAGNIAKLYNVTDAADEIIGTTSYSDSTDGDNTPSMVVGVFTIAAQKTFELQHRCGITVATFGFGFGANISTPETYTIVELWKVK